MSITTKYSENLKL